MNIDNDIEFNEYLEKLSGYHLCLTPTMDCDNCSSTENICFIGNEYDCTDVLLKVVEQINTSSGNVDGKRYYITISKSWVTVDKILDDNGGCRFLPEVFDWSEHNGMIGALKEAIYYIYREMNYEKNKRI